MGAEKSLIIASLCFSICCGQNCLNSTDFPAASNSLINSTNSCKYTDNRIVGGTDIDITSAPFQISINLGNVLVCGGSIISAVWVLTAAHCFAYGYRLKIRAGSSFYRRGGTIHYARYAIVHPGYNDRTLSHDIAMIKVKKPFKWSAKVKPVILARPNFKTPAKMLVTGWGIFNEFKDEYSEMLKAAIISRVSHRACERKYKYFQPVPKETICAGSLGKDTCEGDSGGPLTKKGVQYGITSYGYGCARPGYAGIYTKVASHFRWIKRMNRKYGNRKP